MSNKVRRIYLDEKAGIFDYDLDGEHVLMPWSEYERLRARIEEQHGEIGLLLKRIEELESAEHLQNPTKSGGFGEREVSDE